MTLTLFGQALILLLCLCAMPGVTVVLYAAGKRVAGWINPRDR